VIPKWLGSTHPRFRTPYAALGAFAVVTLIALIPMASAGVPGLTAYAYISTPASLLLIVVFIGANLLLWRLYRKDYTAEFSWWKHLAFPILGSAVLLLPLIAQFYPAPPHPLNLLPIFAGAWILIGVVILVTGGQRVQAASGAFLDSQSASALIAPEDRQ
jgi:amino acid transporter